MTDQPPPNGAIDLDQRRGMAAQQATELRRLADKVEERRNTLRRQQDELERVFLDTPAADWPHAADKARYLLGLYADLAGANDTRVKTLIASVLADFERLGKG
jgi:hypothetical protein